MTTTMRALLASLQGVETALSQLSTGAMADANRIMAMVRQIESDTNLAKSTADGALQVWRPPTPTPFPLPLLPIPTAPTSRVVERTNKVGALVLTLPQKLRRRKPNSERCVCVGGVNPLVALIPSPVPYLLPPTPTHYSTTPAILSTSHPHPQNNIKRMVRGFTPPPLFCL